MFFNFVLTKAIALDCKERKVPQFHADIDAIDFWSPKDSISLVFVWVRFGDLSGWVSIPPTNTQLHS